MSVLRSTLFTLQIECIQTQYKLLEENLRMKRHASEVGMLKATEEELSKKLSHLTRLSDTLDVKLTNANAVSGGLEILLRI